VSAEKKITIVGAGYVGMSLSVLLAQKNSVLLHDIDSKKVNLVNSKQSTINDKFIDEALANNDLALRATIDKEEAYIDSDMMIVATPTDFNESSKKFDTVSVDSVIKDALKINEDIFIIIKSTIPVGHTEYLREKFSTKQIIFSPEFLREGNAFMDSLYPTRIIIGGDCNNSKSFARLLVEGSNISNIEPIFTSSSEAEAIKLFANTFLAMRVAFFNEVDSFAMVHNINTANIIDGV